MNESLKKSLELTKKILKIVKLIVIVGIAFVGVLAVVCLLTNITEEMVASNSVNIGPMNLTLVFSSIINPENLKLFIVAALLCAAVILLIIVRGIQLIDEMVSSALASSPFTSVVSNNLKKLSRLIVIGGCIDNAMEIFVAYRTYYSIDYTLLFNPAIVQQVDFSVSFSVGFLFVAALVYLLSRIFEYGQELQTLSDETL